MEHTSYTFSPSAGNQFTTLPGSVRFHRIHRGNVNKALGNHGVGIYKLTTNKKLRNIGGYVNQAKGLSTVGFKQPKMYTINELRDISFVPRSGSIMRVIGRENREAINVNMTDNDLLDRTDLRGLPPGGPGGFGGPGGGGGPGGPEGPGGPNNRRRQILVGPARGDLLLNIPPPNIDMAMRRNPGFNVVDNEVQFGVDQRDDEAQYSNQASPVESNTTLESPTDSLESPEDTSYATAFASPATSAPSSQPSSPVDASTLNTTNIDQLGGIIVEAGRDSLTLLRDAGSMLLPMGEFTYKQIRNGFHQVYKQIPSIDQLTPSTNPEVIEQTIQTAATVLVNTGAFTATYAFAIAKFVIRNLIYRTADAATILGGLYGYMTGGRAVQQAVKQNPEMRQVPRRRKSAETRWSDQNDPLITKSRLSEDQKMMLDYQGRRRRS